MSIPRNTLAVIAAVAIAASAACSRAQQKLTPEEAHAKGDALLREMSKNFSALQTFAYTVDERREQVSRSGAKTERHAKRHITVRRPNGVAFTGSGDGGETAGWYDGSHLTVMSARDKVWARGPMPATLDEALDFLAAEYSVPLPSADLLYSSPYDALMTPDTKGGWVDVQKIGDLSCEHLSYQQEAVDWEIWLGPERRLPCQLKITYKKDPGQPVATVTYSNLESPQVTDETFTAKIPSDYQRIRIMRHATVNDPKAEVSPAKTTTK